MFNTLLSMFSSTGGNSRSNLWGAMWTLEVHTILKGHWATSASFPDVQKS